MEVADRIAVVNAGRIEQVGTPREVYDRPASAFVMSFVGPVSRLGERLVRPHDVTISLDQDPESIEAQVRRVVHLGFEVRLELALRDNSVVRAQLTRAQAQELELDAGDIVFVRPPAGVPVDPVLRGALSAGPDAAAAVPNLAAAPTTAVAPAPETA